MNDDRPKNAHRPTIRAIAEAAGVSRGTVDRALNNRGDVNAEVAARIRELARELGYVPNKAAKALRFNYEPRTIGVVLPQTSSGFFDQIESGVAQAQAELAGMGIHTSVLRFDPRSEAGLVELFARLEGRAGDSAPGPGESGRVDGAILTGPDTAAVRDAVSHLIAEDIPVITINSDISVAGKLCFVGQDLRRSGVVAAELMAKIVPGPGRVIAVTGNLAFQAHRDRISGFRDGIDQWAPELTVDVREGFDVYDQTRDCVRAAMAEADRAGEPIVGLYMATGSIEAALDVVRSHGASASSEAGMPAARNRVRVITNDALPIVRAGLARREIDFSILQDPLHQGSVPVRMLADYLLSGTRPEPWYRSPILIMGASNADWSPREEIGRSPGHSSLQ
ncbi:MAG TPA: LacI family DNA-binding transcriptional regulator [Spirochaetia bacterium]|nr:LacI family DNA-binding transcriptional regulator [Spirochaetia bacterium]